jgi:NADPH2:quinone reductase
MKAIRVNEFGGPEQLVLEVIDDPRPGPGEVLVKIHAVGINPVETYIRTGTHAVKPELPYTPGHDAAGEIVALGDDVTGLSVGDRVYTSRTVTGSYAELAVAEETRVHPLPDALSFAQGAAINTPYVTAYWSLHRRGQARPGETVLVHGASGGVGSAAVQLAVANGNVVIGTAGTDLGRRLVADLGADHVLDHNVPGYLDQLLRITGDHGVDVILEMLSDVNLGSDLKIIAMGGRVVVIGCRGTVDINPRDAMMREASIHGVLMANATPADIASIHAALGAGLRNGTLRPVVGKDFPLANAAEAHKKVLAAGAYGKIILLPS